MSLSTHYFADRPQREVGHMLSRLFVANWAAGDNSFADNPPNAVLSFAKPGDRLPQDTVVAIQDPHLDGDALSYSIELLDAPRRPPPGHVRCSSTRSGVPCHRSP